MRLLTHLQTVQSSGRRWSVRLLFAVHRLAWTVHPTMWLCEACAILWLVLRAVRFGIRSTRMATTS